MKNKPRWERINLYSIIVKEHKSEVALTPLEQKVYDHYMSLPFEERIGGLEYYKVGDHEFRYRARTPYVARKAA